MKTRFFSTLLVYIFLFVCGSVFGLGEKVIILGGGSTWNLAENKNGVTEVRSVRPYPVLVLSSAANTSTDGYYAASGVLGNFTALAESALDASLSFDESNTALYKDSTGRYRISVSPQIEAVDRRHARAGTGAALFNDLGALNLQPQSREALFAPGNRIRDFSVEFWLYPLNLENGEQILSWHASIPANNTTQRIHCAASKNRLSWTFTNFFTSTNEAQTVSLEFTGNAPVIPKTWSHHLVRFDATTGMLEYIVDGVSEAIVYATATGREKSEVYTPIVGANGAFRLGERFMGLMDEFKIHSSCVDRLTVQKYVPAGGRVETHAINLGENNSGVLRIEASGGRISIRGNNTNNEFRENGRFRFSDNTEMNFFIRTSDNPYLLNNSRWVPFTPGSDLSGIEGRYVQIAVDFYPSADGESSPYLSELRIVYLPGEPPLPPANVTAVAVDSGVVLRWKPSPDANAGGYLVYYSAIRGELFGSDAALGPSPIDAGNRTSIYIEGLKNGALYYFRIAAYDENYNAGEFSTEVRARPLAGLSLSDVMTAR